MVSTFLNRYNSYKGFILLTMWGYSMKRNFTQFINKHQLLHNNATVLIGVSGGPDSMALLHLLVSLREQWNLRLIALSVDHQLRGEESKADVQYVKEMCDQWGVEVITTAIDVRTYEKKHRISTQVAARELRYDFYREQMAKLRADYLALGHHGDDQVETMLMSIVRTASSASLLGIPVKRKFSHGLLIRPLLGASKAQIKQYCQQNDIHPRFDPSNKDIEDTRVFFRKKIIPIIKEKNDNIHTTIQYLSESLQEDESFLQKEAKQLLNDLIQYGEDGQSASFKIDQFKTYAQALQRRFFHLILNYLYDGKLPKSLSYTHENHFFELINEQHGTVNMNFPRQLIVERSYDTLSFYFEQNAKDEPFKKEIIIPGETTLPDGSMISTQIVSERYIDQDEYTYICAEKAVTLPLYIRTRRPGDRISWKGLNGSKKLKDLFIDEKIARNERDTWPIVVDQQGNLLWVIGLRKGEIKCNDHHNSWIQLRFKQGR